MNDIHISKDNIPEFIANWREALSVCEKYGIKEIALGGDLFQSRVSQTLDVLLAIHDALLEAAGEGIHVTLANGNHDLVNQEAIRGYCHIFDEFGNVTVVDDYLTLTFSEWDFALHIIAYFPENGSFRDKLGALVVGGLEEHKQNFLYIHQGINGALAQPSEDELPADMFRRFHRTFVGHYHNRCTIPGTTIEYIGSSRQHNFGEDEQKGYTILYSDGSQTFIQNQVNTRYRTIDIDAAKVGIHLTDELSEIKAEGRYKVRVRIHAPANAPGIDRTALMEAGAAKVEIITEQVEQIEVEQAGLFERFDSRKIKESYAEFCTSKQIENPELGLHYLSKIEQQPCGN